MAPRLKSSSSLALRFKDRLRDLRRHDLSSGWSGEDVNANEIAQNAPEPYRAGGCKPGAGRSSHWPLAPAGVD
jgi:hypothetical protein